MEISDIKHLIEEGIPGCQAKVSGEGCNASVVVISDAFEGKSRVAQQKMVYATLGERIASGEIHALSIKSFTPEQWDKFPEKESI